MLIGRNSGPPGPYKRRQIGLSLVELMVGVAVGLFVVAGATLVVSNQLGDNRRLMLETQIQQDLRAAADLIARDLRRSGYWASAESGVWHGGAMAVSSNPYTELQGVSSGTPASAVQFGYSRGAVENNALDDATERSGFRLNNGVIQMYTGGAWQALTDGTTLRVTNFEVRLNAQDIELACLKECPGGGTACLPRQTVRDFTVVIEGAAVHDAAVRRGAQSNARLRNDVIQGACPV
jgi:prepilin peptidase dependent protein B